MTEAPPANPSFDPWPESDPDTTLPCTWVPTENFTARRPETDPPRQPEFLILHYTAMTSTERALYWLTTPESQVSCHYLIAENGDIFQMVREEMRAWQAGASYWRGESDVNSASIGIEIANPGPTGDCPEFPDVQMEAVRDLSADICARHHFGRHQVLAHSDIAPGRKVDPGPHFDWEWLAKEGVGFWPKAWSSTGDPQDIRTTQRRLAEIGYKIDVTGEADAQTTTVISAFQLHWRKACFDGRLDGETAGRIADVWGAIAAVG